MLSATEVTEELSKSILSQKRQFTLAKTQRRKEIHILIDNVKFTEMEVVL